MGRVCRVVRKAEEDKGCQGPPIASGNGVGWPLSDITEHFIATYAGPEMTHALIKKEVKWTDPAVKSVFTDRLAPLLKAGYFSEPIEWTMALDLWWRGEIMASSSWAAGLRAWSITRMI